jgi:hypothetical protein
LAAVRKNKNMEINKKDLEESFKKGMSYDYRPTFFMCFNRWYNERFIDFEKCNSCKYSDSKSKTNHRTCEKCIDCSLFDKK